MMVTQTKNTTNSVRNGAVPARSGVAAKLGLLAVSALLMVGCMSMPTEVDMQADRRANLSNDLERLARENVALPDSPMTLQQCIDTALQNNLDLRVAQWEIEMARENAYGDKLRMLPDLDLTAERSKRDRDVRQNTVDAAGNVTVGEVTRGRNTLRADLALTWNVLDFGLSYVRARQAQLGVKAMELERIRQGQVLALEVTESYWRAALAEDALDYIRKIEAELKNQKKIIDRSVQSRRIDPIAATDASKRLVDLQIIIRDLQAEVSGARVNLAQLMGLRQNQQFTIQRESIRPLLAALPRPEQLEVAKLEEFAMLNRPELYAQDLDHRIRQDDVRAEMLQMFPDLTFGVGTHYNHEPLLNANRWNTFGVNFGWNLLAIPERIHRKHAAENSVEAAQYERMQLTVGVLTQVNLALLDYAVKVDRFLLMEESYTLTNDLLNMVRNSNKAGRITDLAVTQRSLEDVASKLRRDRSVVDALVGYRRLLVSTGLSADRWNTSLADLGLLRDVQIARPSDAAPAPRESEMVVSRRVISQDPAASTTRVTTNRTVAPARIIDAPTRVVAQSSQPVAGSVISRRVISSEPRVSTTTTTTRRVVSQPESRVVRSSSSYGPASTVTRSVTSVTSTAGASGVMPYAIQLGAFKNFDVIEPLLKRVEAAIPRLVKGAEPMIATTEVNGKTIYRARYSGFTKAQANQACNTLKGNKIDCWVDLQDEVQVAAAVAR